jgi:hypothetical protein
MCVSGKEMESREVVEGPREKEVCEQSLKAKRGVTVNSDWFIQANAYTGLDHQRQSG